MDTLETRLRSAMPDLTRAERQLAQHMLANFPVSALGPVAEVAGAAGVSGPTVVRLVRKLGCSGYADFRAQLHRDLGERLASPLAKHEKWADSVAADHDLTLFARSLVAALDHTLSQLDIASFDAAVSLLSDPARPVHMVGGRLTQAAAGYFSTALRVMRPDVGQLSSLPSSWLPAVLDMTERDVLVVFDIRRYEPSVQQLAEHAHGQGAEIILLTDKWISPAASVARHILTSHIEVPSAWDSVVPLFAIVEAMLASIQERTWAETRERLDRMEGLYEKTRLFRRLR